MCQAVAYGLPAQTPFLLGLQWGQGSFYKRVTEAHVAPRSHPLHLPLPPLHVPVSPRGLPVLPALLWQAQPPLRVTWGPSVWQACITLQRVGQTPETSDVVPSIGWGTVWSQGDLRPVTGLEWHLPGSGLHRQIAPEASS